MCWLEQEQDMLILGEGETDLDLSLDSFCFELDNDKTIMDEDQTAIILCISIASSCIVSPSSLPTKSYLLNSKYLYPIIIVLTLISKLELFLITIYEFPNLSILLS